MEYGNNPGAGKTNGAGIDANAAMRDQVEQYRDQAVEMAQKAQEWIQENPGYAVVGAAAVGFLFARFVARRRS